MKKIFTLFAILLSAVVANAQSEYYEYYFDGATEHKAEDYFTHSSKHSITSGISGGVTFKMADGSSVKATSGLKFEGATTVQFSNARPATVIIVESTKRNNGPQTVAFDGEVLTDGVTEPEGYTNAIVYTIENVAVGEHTINKNGSDQFDLTYIGVILEDAKGTQLEAPEITFDKATGEVTIGAVENATKIVYTTDGSLPLAESEEYTEPFTVEDYTTVKAVAIGDGEDFSDSPVAEVLVALEGFTVETPVITQHNGSFYVTCATTNANIEISLNGGEYKTYEGALTVTEDTQLAVRASRENCTSSEATAEIKALPAVKADKVIYIGMGSYSKNNEKIEIDGKSCGIMYGIAGDEKQAYGFNLIGHRENWDWSSSSGQSIYIDAISDKRTGMKTAGQPLELQIPEGIKVNRLTIYSYNNYDGDSEGGWEVKDPKQEYVTIPTWCRSGYGSAPQNADVRMFNFDGQEGSITFQEVGQQKGFVLAISIEEAVAPEAPTAMLGEEEHDGSEIKLDGKPVDVTFTLADEAHHIYYHFAKAENTPAQDPNEVEGPGEMSMAKATAEEDLPATIDHENGKTYTHATDKKVTLKEAGTLSFFAYHPESGLMSDVKEITVSGEGTSGIAEIAVDGVNAPVEYFNIQGQRIDNPAEGIYIRREGNKVSKVVVK